MNQIAPERKDAPPNRQIRLDCGLVVSLNAYALACDLEQRGCQLVVDGDGVLVGSPGIATEDDLDEIRRHRDDLKLIIGAGDARVNARCREILEEEGNDYSVQEVDRVRRSADEMAKLIIEAFQSKDRSE